MKRFGYWRDPLCLSCIALYAVNRWWLKPRLGPGFFHDHFNDLLLIPAALPLLLWVHRRLGWRTNDRPPSTSEIFLHLAVWSVVCEVIGPRFLPHATGDWGDAVAYGVGALAAGVCWNYSTVSTALMS